MTRRSLRVRPMIDGLESRRLLSARAGHAVPAIVGQNPLNVRAFSYYAPSGARVTMELKGNGNLNGTSVDSSGALNLVYGGTNAASKIYVTVSRGTAPLRSVEEASLPKNDYTGIGGQLLGSLLAPQLDLVAGGDINMTSGVGRLQLHSLGADTQVHLRDLPSTFPASTSTTNSNASSTTITNVSSSNGIGGTGLSGTSGTTGSSTTGTTTSTGSTATGGGSTGTGTNSSGTIPVGGSSSGTSGSTTSTGSTSTGGGTLGSTGGSTGTNSSGTTPVGGSSSASSTSGTLTGLINNPSGLGLFNGTPNNAQSTNSTFTVTSTTTVTGGNGNQVKIPPGEEAVALPQPASAVAPTTYTFAGRTQTYSNDANGGTTLASVTGQFAATPNLITTPNPANPGPPPQPPGILIQLDSVNAPGGQIGDAQVWAYDAVANALVRFDAVSGAILQAVPVGGTPTNAAGVGLGRNGSELVVLLARGNVVQPFDASTGTALPAFTTNDLAGYGFRSVDGVAFTGTVTVLSDSSASVPVGQATTDFGVSVGIDVAASIAGGLAVPLGTKSFVTDNGFSYSGASTGLVGSNNVYNFGAAIFDAYQAPFRQAGVLTTTGYYIRSPREVTRVAEPNPSNPQNTTPYVNYGGASGPLTGTGPALGSVEQLLALDAGVSNGVNVVRLLVPSTLTTAGSVNLQDADPLVAISGSFHPELVGSALVDVQGNIQTFSAKKATGLALNDNGNLDLLQINTATNSTVVAQPLSHVQIAHRSNVVLATPNRSVGTRNGVFILTGLRPIGPLTLPS